MAAPAEPEVPPDGWAAQLPEGWMKAPAVRVPQVPLAGERLGLEQGHDLQKNVTKTFLV